MNMDLKPSVVMRSTENSKDDEFNESPNNGPGGT